MKNKLEYLLFISIGGFFSVFGINSARYFGKLLALFFYYILRIRRSTVHSNLQTAFPEYSKDIIEKIAFQNYLSFCIMLVELFSIKKLTNREIIELVDCSELLAIASDGKIDNGGFFLTAHYGNWEAGGISAGVQLNLEMNVVAKQQRNELVFNWLNSMRESFGNKVIPLGPSVREVYKAINDKKMVGVVGDQRGPIEGDRVKFFERDTAVFQGTASIALKKNVPIIVAFLERQSNFKYKIIANEIEYKKYSGTDEEIIHEINQEYMRLLEKQVRKKPEQWFWMHKIWKY